MNNDTGSPTAMVIVYGMARGEYDDYLWEIAQAIRARRRAKANVGSIVLSRGDRAELMDDLKITALQSAIVRVVRIHEDRRKIVVKIEKTALPTHYLGRVVAIKRDWVLCLVEQE